MDFAQQKSLFDIPEEICYLNTASLSPSFKAVELAGIEAVLQKSRPFTIPPSDFFEPVTLLKKKFAQIIDVENYERIATIPSVSYGIATVTKNIRLKKGDVIILLQDQFPSNYYSWKKLADESGAKLKIIQAPKVDKEQGRLWNEAILEAIDENTAVVSMGHIHWSNGTRFDLEKIRKKTAQHEALLIIDGSQSIGALPFSVKNLQPDAVICAGYKWLFGPYGCGYAYYGPYFDQGQPLEESWTNRKDSHKTHDLTDYQSEYKPMANRYVMGESGSFIYVKMQLAALNQVQLWSPDDIQEYCYQISHKAVKQLQSLGCTIEEDHYRSQHLFGFKLPQNLDIKKFKKALNEHQIFLSFRGDYVRVSCHFFNTEEDFNKLVQCLRTVIDTTEYIDILNADGSFTGKSCSKSEIHSQGHYHNTAHIWFYNQKGEILLAQRSANKEISPLLWNVSVAGHVDTGETVFEAAIRETQEEIGIPISAEILEKIGIFDSFRSYPNGIQDNEFHHTFVAKINYSLPDFTLDKEEVAQVKFVSIPQFKELLEHSEDNNHFIASNRTYYLDVLEAIEKRK